MLLNCGVGEDSLESLALQGDEITMMCPNGVQGEVERQSEEFRINLVGQDHEGF